MNERFITGIATGLTAVLVIFILGFSLGRNPTGDAMLLVSSQPVMESSAVSDTESVSETADSSTSSLPEPSQSDDSAAFPVDLNTADAAQLDLVPGIGEVIAARIIEYRNLVGKFKTVDELLNVKGIGEKTLEEMREFLTVSE